MARRNRLLKNYHWKGVGLETAEKLHKSPGGTAENHPSALKAQCLSISAVPDGTGSLRTGYPGLTSWAILNRPFGTLVEFFRSLFSRAAIGSKILGL